MTTAGEPGSVLAALATKINGLAAEADQHRDTADQTRQQLTRLWSGSQHPTSQDVQTAVTRGTELAAGGRMALLRAADLLAAAANRT